MERRGHRPTRAFIRRAVSALSAPSASAPRPIGAKATLSIMTNSIVAEGLTKRFGTVTAVDGIDLQVKEGSVFGLLGPNGDGKTTTVHILSTLVSPDEGHAAIAGYDIQEPRPTRSTSYIGLAGRCTSIDGVADQNQDLRPPHPPHRPAPAAKRSSTPEQPCSQFNLEDAATHAVRPIQAACAGASTWPPAWSHATHPVPRRARHRPQPRSRNDMWNVVRDLTTSHGVTVLLTTQYLEEADQLAERSRSSTTAT